MSFHETYVEPGLTGNGAMMLPEGKIKPTFDVDEYILQTCKDGDTGRVKKAVELYERLQGSEVPVPEVVEDHTDDPVPYYVVENVEGEVPGGRVSSWSDERAEEVAFQAGRHLGNTHKNLDYDEPGYGVLWSQDDRMVVHGYESWPEYLEDFFSRTMESVEAEDLFEEEEIDHLGEAAREVRGSAPEKPEKSILHGDYGPHNVIVDGSSVEAVIDWDNAVVGPPAFDYAKAEAYFADRFMGDTKEKVKHGFREGYRSTTGTFLEQEQIDSYGFAHAVEQVAGVSNTERDDKLKQAVFKKALAQGQRVLEE